MVSQQDYFYPYRLGVHHLRLMLEPRQQQYLREIRERNEEESILGYKES
jgi:hypothetical protein